ncbi:MAG TPA: hypothetical protein VF135_09790, partial [Terriglobales bacterium]
MKQKYLSFVAALFLLSSSGVLCSAQTKPKAQPATPAPTKKAKSQALTPQQKFVLDVVQSAVALPQGDPQDRLRVLSSAANVISTVRPALARKFATEGMRIEQELISTGQSPAVSILEVGHVDCAAAESFVENIPVEKVNAAEQSLISAQALCPRQVGDTVRQKVEAALDQGVVAPRALLATIEAVGSKTPWAQQAFEKLFSNLPSDAEASRQEAPNYAAM